MSAPRPKDNDIERKWYVTDATDVVLGRLATHAVDLLCSKGKACFAPNVDCGDHVIVINADKMHVSLNKREREMHYRHSGFPGGLKSMALGRPLGVHPERVITEATEGMMLHNKLSCASTRKLHIFAGSEHLFAGQKPENYEIKMMTQ